MVGQFLCFCVQFWNNNYICISDIFSHKYWFTYVYNLSFRLENWYWSQDGIPIPGNLKICNTGCNTFRQWIDESHAECLWNYLRIRLCAAYCNGYDCLCSSNRLTEPLHCRERIHISIDNANATPVV
jgi:hypothetical protein